MKIQIEISSNTDFKTFVNLILLKLDWETNGVGTAFKQIIATNKLE